MLLPIDNILKHQNILSNQNFIFHWSILGLKQSYSEFDDSEAQVVEYNNRYDIIVHRRVNHSEIPPETVFGCVLRIPGTDYEIREESIYKHRHGKRKFPVQVVNCQCFINIGMICALGSQYLGVPKVNTIRKHPLTCQSCF